MQGGGSSSSYKLRSLVRLLYRYRVCSSSTDNANQSSYYGLGGGVSSNFGYGIGGSMHPSLRNFSTDGLDNRNPETSNKVESDNVKAQPSPPPPPRSSIFTWGKWLLALIVPILATFWKQKWDKLLKLEGEVEAAVEVAENVAEVVEMVASETEKVSADMAEKLDNGELKEVALMVEHASNVVIKDAQTTEDIIHKVGDLKQDLEDLGKIVEPAIDGIIHKDHDGK